jgi:hypothetical protein
VVSGVRADELAVVRGLHAVADQAHLDLQAAIAVARTVGAAGKADRLSRARLGINQGEARVGQRQDGANGYSSIPRLTL